MSLSGPEKDVMRALEGGPLGLSALVRATGRHDRTLRTAIHALEARQAVQRIGKDRDTRYSLATPGGAPLATPGESAVRTPGEPLAATHGEPLANPWSLEGGRGVASSPRLEEVAAAAAVVSNEDSVSNPWRTPGEPLAWRTPREPSAETSRLTAEVSELRATVASLQTALEALQIHARGKPLGVPAAGLTPENREKIQRAVDERARQSLLNGEPMGARLRSITYCELSSKALVGDWYEVNAYLADADAFAAEQKRLQNLPEILARQQAAEEAERAEGRRKAIEEMSAIKARRAREAS